MVIAFFLGYRTITVAPGFLLHPIDIIIVALFLKALTLPRTSQSTYPLWLILLLPFAIWGLFNGIFNTWNPIRVWYDFKNFALIFPLFFIVDRFIKSDESIPPIAYVNILVIASIALFGVMEYYVPPFRQLLSGFYNVGVENMADAQGFVRASFTFWGAITVGHIMITALPLISLIPKESKTQQSNTVFVLFSLLINIVAFYIMGNRADWLALILLSGLFYVLIFNRKANLSKQAFALFILFIGIGFVLQNLDQAFIDRFITGVEAITTPKEGYDPHDSSGYKRQQRLFSAIQTITKKPLGIGWSNSGWVHSDFIQITANIGWVGGILFFGGYISLAAKSFFLVFNPLLTEREKDITAALTMSHAATGFMLAVNNNYVLTQTGVPLFFLWALLHVYVTKLKRELPYRTTRTYHAQAQRTAAYIQ